MACTLIHDWSIYDSLLHGLWIYDSLIHDWWVYDSPMHHWWVYGAHLYMVGGFITYRYMKQAMNGATKKNIKSCERYQPQAAH